MKKLIKEEGLSYTADLVIAKKNTEVLLGYKNSEDRARLLLTATKHMIALMAVRLGFLEFRDFRGTKKQMAEEFLNKIRKDVD